MGKFATQGEGNSRSALHDRMQVKRADAKAYTVEMLERRDRRIAVLLLSDALDLTRNIPIPEALEKRGREEYRGTLEGVLYRVNIATWRVYNENNGEARNRELGRLVLVPPPSPKQPANTIEGGV